MLNITLLTYYKHIVYILKVTEMFTISLVIHTFEVICKKYLSSYSVKMSISYPQIYKAGIESGIIISDFLAGVSIRNKLVGIIR